MNYLRQLKTSKRMLCALGLSVVAILIAIAIPVGTSAYKSYATVDYWDLMAGDKTVAVFASENDAKQVVKDVTNYYVKKGADVEEIKCTPQLTVAQKTYDKDDEVKLAEVKDTVEYIVTGTRHVVTYTVKEGDTFWEIANKKGFTVNQLMKMNPDIDDYDDLYIGDKLKLYKMKPLVKVTTTQVVSSKRTLGYKTVVKKSSKYMKGTKVVKREGTNGTKKVTERITTENDSVVEIDEIKSKVLVKPKKRIVIEGTKVVKPTKTHKVTSTRKSKSSSVSTGGNYTGSGSGSAVVSYAMRFLGNPYRYGGTSLTNGCDCSGFVMSVYAHFGVRLPHGAGQRSVGRAVSYSNAQPGDIICQPGHVGIYIGGGKMVNALNPRKGITVSNVRTIGRVITVRRVI